eukprot:6487498-Amphidinium_carterae.1
MYCLAYLCSIVIVIASLCLVDTHTCRRAGDTQQDYRCVAAHSHSTGGAGRSSSGCYSLLTMSTSRSGPSERYRVSPLGGLPVPTLSVPTAHVLLSSELCVPHTVQ